MTDLSPPAPKRGRPSIYEVGPYVAPPAVAYEDGSVRKCKPCQRDFLRSDFSGGYCRECLRKKGASRARENHLKTRYGLTLEDWKMLQEKAGGYCPLCKVEFTDIPSSRGARAIDHCHETSTVRGLICAACNQGIGLFENNPEALRAAADYLEQHLEDGLAQVGSHRISPYIDKPYESKHKRKNGSIDEQTVLAVWNASRSAGRSVAARQFGLNLEAVYCIWSRKTYRRLTDGLPTPT